MQNAECRTKGRFAPDYIYYLLAIIYYLLS